MVKFKIIILWFRKINNSIFTLWRNFSQPTFYLLFLKRLRVLILLNFITLNSHFWRIFTNYYLLWIDFCKIFLKIIQNCFIWLFIFIHFLLTFANSFFGWLVWWIKIWSFQIWLIIVLIFFPGNNCGWTKTFKLNILLLLNK